MKNADAFLFRLISAALFLMGAWTFFDMLRISEPIIAKIGFGIMCGCGLFTFFGILLTDNELAATLRRSTRLTLIMLFAAVNLGAWSIRWLITESAVGYGLAMTVLCAVLSAVCGFILAYRLESDTL
ncbi:MAG: hypothetical protein ACI4Q6_08265 [Huintestinicola sp.]